MAIAKWLTAWLEGKLYPGPHAIRSISVLAVIGSRQGRRRCTNGFTMLALVKSAKPAERPINAIMMRPLTLYFHRQNMTMII